MWNSEDRFVTCNSSFRKIHSDTEQFLKPNVSFEEYQRHRANSGTIAEAEGRVEQWVEETLKDQKKSTFHQRLSYSRWEMVPRKATEIGRWGSHRHSF